MQNVKTTNSGPGVQSCMESFVSIGHSAFYGPSSVRQKALTSSLVTNLIVSCGLPMSIVDDENFRSFLSLIDPKNKPPCRQTVSSSLLPQLKHSSQAKLQVILDNSHDLALTADIWTDRRMHAFLGVTIHAFNSGRPVSCLLSFQSFKGSHTGVKISEALEKVINDHNIQPKIRGIVTDNASNMRKALSVMLEVRDNQSADDENVDDPSLWEDDTDIEVMNIVGESIEHIPCFAHSLQLVVRDGLATLTTARSLFAKCCKLANIVHQSANFRASFEKAMGDGKSIPSTNDTRWNSTYKQLIAIALLDQTKLSELLHSEDYDNLVLTTKEYCQLLELIKILSIFSQATDLTQGDKTVTISCVVPIILALTTHLETMMQSPGSLLSFIKTLLHSLQDRFSGVFNLLGIAIPMVGRKSND